MIIYSLEILKLNNNNLEILTNTNKIVFNPNINFIHGTDNSVGKSTLLECINFCLGSNPRKTRNSGANIEPQIFCCKDELKDLYLALTFTHSNNEKSKILRNTTESNNTIYIQQDSFLYKKYSESSKYSNSFKEVTDKGLESYYSISNTNYKNILEKEMFDLPDDFDFTFRKLIEFFLRVVGHPCTSVYKSSSEKLAIQILYLLKFTELNWSVKYNENEFRKIEKTIHTVIMNSLNIENTKNYNQALEQIDTNIVKQTDKLKEIELKLQEEFNDSDNEQKWDQLAICKKERSELYNKKRPLEQEKKDLKDQLDNNIDNDQKEIQSILSEAGIVFSQDLMPYLDSIIKFHYEILQDRKEDIDNKINKLEKSIEELWDEIHRKNKDCDGIECFIKKSSDNQIVREYEATKESHNANIRKLEVHKEMLENILEQIPKLKEYKKREQEWIQSNKKDLDTLISKYIKWYQEVYKGEYECIEMKLYNDDGLKFNLKGGHGKAESETAQIMFDIWLLENSPYAYFLLHDSFMFHGIENPHIDTLFNIILNHIQYKQYIFTLNENELNLLSEKNKKIIENNTIITLTYDACLFGIRIQPPKLGGFFILNHNILLKYELDNCL